MNPPKETPWINRILSAVFMISMGVSSYFINTTINSIKELETRVYTLEINSATVAGNRFTSGDFVQAKAVIDQQILTADKRIIVLEEQNKAIKSLLEEIKFDIKELKPK